MRNPYHYRAQIDRLWRRSAAHNPNHIRLKALGAIVRELFVPNDRAQLNYRMYLATDPFDVARHQLRDLYDRACPTVLASEDTCRPTLPPGEGSHVLIEEETLEEDDDPW